MTERSQGRGSRRSNRIRAAAQKYAAGLAIAVAVVAMAPEPAAFAVPVAIVRDRRRVDRFDSSELICGRLVLTIPIEEATFEADGRPCLN